MRSSIEKVNRFLDSPLDVGPRILLVLAFLCLVPTYFAPLYNMTMFAPQYQEGLRLDIYSYKLVGGNEGQDVKEINVLNHYIGMRDLVTEDFTEFNWLPFAIGIFGLLFLRAAVLGKASHLVDVAVLFVYFGLFALWSFGYKMYQYGHTLDPKAAVRVDPFMPPHVRLQEARELRGVLVSPARLVRARPRGARPPRRARPGPAAVAA